MSGKSLHIQCTARSKRSGNQCMNWAVRGALVCRMHGAGGTAEAPSPGLQGAKARIEDAEQQLKQRLFELHGPALEAVQSILEDPSAKASDRLRAAESVLNRFVPTKAETKVSVDSTEARDLDEEIAGALGLEPDAPDADAG